MDDVKDIIERVKAARGEFKEFLSHPDLPPQERLEAMLVDIFGLLYTEFYIRKGE